MVYRATPVTIILNELGVAVGAREGAAMEFGLASWAIIWAEEAGDEGGSEEERADDQDENAEGLFNAAFGVGLLRCEIENQREAEEEQE